MVHDTTFIKHGKAWVDCLKAAEAEPRPGLGAYHGHGRSEHLPPPTVGIRVLKPFPEPRPTNHCSEGQAADDPQHSEHANQSPGGRNVASARRLIGMFAVLGVVCSLAFTAVVGWTRLWERFQDPDPYRGRREMLTSAVAMVRAKPWTGFGLGSFETVYPGFAVFDEGSVVDHAHNDWAEWASEGGLPLLACVLAIAVWGTPRLVQSLWGLGVLAVWLHALVDFPMQTPALALWVFVLLGGACAQRVPPNKLPWA